MVYNAEIKNQLENWFSNLEPSFAGSVRNIGTLCLTIIKKINTLAQVIFSVIFSRPGIFIISGIIFTTVVVLFSKYKFAINQINKKIESVNSKKIEEVKIKKLENLTKEENESLRQENLKKLNDLEKKYSFKLTDFLKPEQTEDWKKALEDSDKKTSFIAFSKELLNLFNNACYEEICFKATDTMDEGYEIHYTIGDCKILDILLKIKDLAGKDQFKAFMLTVIPTYPLIMGAKELNTYNTDQRRQDFFNYFIKQCFRIENSNKSVYIEVDNDPYNHWLDTYKKDVEDEIRSIVFNLYKNSYLNESYNELIVEQFTEELFAEGNQPNEWSQGVKRGTLAPFCQKLSKHLIKEKNQFKVGVRSGTEIFQRLHDLIGKDQFRKLMKAADSSYPCMKGDKEESRQLFALFANLDEESWQEKVGALKTNKFCHNYNEVLELLETKDPTKYNQFLFQFIEERKNKSKIGHADLCGSFLRHVLKRMDKDGKIGGFSAENLLDWIKCSDEQTDSKFHDVMTSCFLGYPLSLPYSDGDNRNQILFTLMTEKDSYLYTDGYAVSSIRKEFFKLNTEKMRTSLQFVKTHNPKLLNTLLYGAKSNQSSYGSIILNAIKQYKSFGSDGVKCDLSCLLSVLKEVCPEDLKKITTKQSSFQKFVEIGGDTLFDTIVKDYADYFPEVAFFNALQEDEKEKSADTLSKSEILLALLGGNPELLKDKKQVTSVLNKAMETDPKAFLNKNNLESEKWLTLWKHDKKLVKKIFSQSVTINAKKYPNGFQYLFMEGLKDLEDADFEGEKEWEDALFFAEIFFNEPSFFSKYCFDSNGSCFLLETTDISKTKTQLEMISNRILDKGLYKDESTIADLEALSVDDENFDVNQIIQHSKYAKEFSDFFSSFYYKILLTGRGNADIDIIGQRIFTHYPENLPLFFEYAKSKNLCLDQMSNENLVNVLSKYKNKTFDALEELSLINCADLTYKTLSSLFECFPKVNTLTIQTTDVEKMQKILNHLLTEIENDDLESLTIRFADIVPVQYPEEEEPWLNQYYNPIFQRFGLEGIVSKDDERMKLVKGAFEGSITIDKTNTEIVKKWLFAKGFQSLCPKDKLEDIVSAVENGKAILSNRNTYMRGVLQNKPNADAKYILELERLPIKEMPIYGTPEFKKALAIYLLENRIEPTNEIIPLLWNAAVVMNDHEMQRFIQKRCHEAGINLIFEDAEVEE